MVSVDHMLISILSVSVEALGMSCAEAAEALAPRDWDLKPDNLSVLCLIVISGIQTLPVSSSDVRSSPLGPVQTLIASACHNVSFATQTRSCTP